MPKPSKQTAARKANWATAQAIIEQNSDQETLEKALLESKARLHHAQQQIASLESALCCSISELGQGVAFGKTAGKTGQYQEREFGAADFSAEGCCLVTIS